MYLILKNAYPDLDIAVRLMSNEFLGPFLDDFRFGEGSEGCHGAYRVNMKKLMTVRKHHEDNKNKFMMNNN